MRYLFKNVTALPSRVFQIASTSYTSYQEKPLEKRKNLVLPGQVSLPRMNCDIVEVDLETPYAPEGFKNGVKYLKLGQCV